jgi:hypothetical protein
VVLSPPKLIAKAWQNQATPPTHPPTKQSKQSEQIKQSKHSKHSKHSNQSNQSKQIGGGSTAVATITHSCVPMIVARNGV